LLGCRLSLSLNRCGLVCLFHRWLVLVLSLRHRLSFRFGDGG
jgi:hypothetical protein